MTTYSVRVKPGASRTRVGGSYGQPPALVVAVTEPAIDGRANDAVLRALARAVGVRPTGVELATGHTSRTKAVRFLDGPADLDARWTELLGRAP
ncbi:MAG: DUF167 domain-containing protein [bacterium]